MIKKKELRSWLSYVGHLEKEEPFKTEVGILLNCFLLELGVRPRMIPRLTLYETAQKCCDGKFEKDDIMLINAYRNDLQLIHSLIEGVLNNYGSYKPKNALYTLVEKVLTTATSQFIQCATTSIK